MATGIEKILEKTGLKSKDINAKNYKKLKFLLSDEDIKVVEKKLGIDKIAEASIKDQKKPKITVEFGEAGKVKDKGPNPGDAGGSTEKPIKLKKGSVLVDSKTGEVVKKLAKGGFPDLSGDGNITQKDILMGKGVIKMKKGGIVKKKSSRTRIAKRGFGIAKRGY
jgi:hypothetical protein